MRRTLPLLFEDWKSLRRPVFGLLLAFLLLSGLEALSRIFESDSPKYELEIARLEDQLRSDNHDRRQIVVLGGSTVHGLPIPELGFVTQLRNALSRWQPGTQFNLVNAGKPSGDSSYVCEAAKVAISSEADLLIVVTGHNEFLDRPGTGWSQVLRERTSRGSAFARLIGRLRPVARVERRANAPVYPIEHTDPWFQWRLERYRVNLNCVVSIAAGRSIPVILTTMPSNLSDWPPVHKHVEWNPPRSGYDEIVEELTDMLAAGQVAEVSQQLQRHRTVFPKDAMLTFLNGKVEQSGGRIDRARELFLTAKDTDVAPWRVLSQLNNTVREFDSQKGVTLVDLEDAFEQYATDGLVGFDLIADNCHPTPLGNALVAKALFQSILNVDSFADQESNHLLELSVRASAQEWLDLHIANMNEELRMEIRQRYLLANGIYSMKRPFYNFTVARDYLEQAIQEEVDDWRVWANLATVSLFEDKLERATIELEKAHLLKGSRLSPGDWRDHPYLFEAAAKVQRAASGR